MTERQTRVSALANTCAREVRKYLVGLSEVSEVDIWNILRTNTRDNGPLSNDMGTSAEVTRFLQAFDAYLHTISDTVDEADSAFFHLRLLAALSAFPEVPASTVAITNKVIPKAALQIRMRLHTHGLVPYPFAVLAGDIATEACWLDPNRAIDLIRTLGQDKTLRPGLVAACRNVSPQTADNLLQLWTENPQPSTEPRRHDR